MPTIVPVSDLRNYGNVIDKVKTGNPVYLTKNGKGAYVIRTIEEDEIVQKILAKEKLSALLKTVIDSVNRGEVLNENELIAELLKDGIDVRWNRIREE